MNQEIIRESFLLFFCFVLGSVPFGIIVAKAKGVDLKKVGSGNIGATNVLRSLGKLPALLTLFGDILKGTLAVALGRYVFDDPLSEGLAGLAAIFGHNFSIFLSFRGGKGVATSFGVLLLYLPVPALVTLITWVAVAFLSKYSSMGAIVSFGLLPVSVILLEPAEPVKFYISLVVGLLILVRHIGNIGRLLQGKERKIGHRS
jgi:acyl phosphate:glycerol-3-phosphate acyltransferase